MRRARLVLRVGRGRLRAEVFRGRDVVWQAESAFATEEDLMAALGRLAGAEAAAGIATARVELEVPLVQLRTLTDLPPVRRSALRAVVSHQAGRFFRKNGKPLVTDAAWQRHSRGADRTAIAAAVEEPWVEALVQGARVAGIEMASISPVGFRLDLLPDSERAARGRAAAAWARRLALAAAGMWSLVAVLAIHRVTRESAIVEQQLLDAAPAAAAARQVRLEYDGATAMVDTLEAAVRSRGSMTSRLSAILLSLPESAYLTTAHVVGDFAGDVTGAARRPLDVVAALDRVRAVDGARLVGSGTRIPVGGRDYETFTVRFGRDASR